MTCNRIRKGINFHLDNSIDPSVTVIDVTNVEGSFDARVSAVGRTYMYRILTPTQASSPHSLIDGIYAKSRNRPPMERSRRTLLHKANRLNIFQSSSAWVLPAPIDVDIMRAASRQLIGEHDFSSFRAAGCQSRSPIRRIINIQVRKCEESHGDIEKAMTHTASLIQVRQTL